MSMQKKDRAELVRLRKRVKGALISRDKGKEKGKEIEGDMDEEINKLKHQIHDLESREIDSKHHHAIIELHRALKKAKSIELQKIIRDIKKKKGLVERAQEKLKSVRDGDEGEGEESVSPIEKQYKKQCRRLENQESILEFVKKWDPQSPRVVDWLANGDKDVLDSFCDGTDDDLNAQKRRRDILTSIASHTVVTDALGKIREIMVMKGEHEKKGVDMSSSSSSSGLAGVKRGEKRRRMRSDDEDSINDVKEKIRVKDKEKVKRAKLPEVKVKVKVKSVNQSHPSWDAMREKKDREKAAFEGTRITFD